MTDIGTPEAPAYPPPEFWAVIGDICEQGAREQEAFPHSKVIDIQLTRPEWRELRIAYVRDGGNP